MFTKTNILILAAIFLFVVISVCHFYLNMMVKSGFKSKSDTEIQNLKDEVALLKERLAKLESND